LSQGKALVPNIGLVEPMMAVLPNELKDPLLTAEWESLLAQVEKGDYEKAKEFFDKQMEFVRAIVERHKDEQTVQVNKVASKEKAKDVRRYGRSLTNKYGNKDNEAKKDWSNKTGANKFGTNKLDKPLSDKQIAIINKHAPQEIKEAVKSGKYDIGRKWLDEWFDKRKSKNSY